MTRRMVLKNILIALAMAFAVLFFCTKSSFGYPINDWSDANIYLSIGKGMAQGQVVYRDLYDHKGPLLYALHALCALFAQDFTGVFVMEVLLAAAFLALAHRYAQLVGAGRLAWPAAALALVLVYTSFSFAEGDSAEEMALPFIMATLCGVTAFLQSGQRRMSARSLVVHGALAGCVFWIKFTMIGLHAGLLLALLLRHLLRREGREALRALGWLAAGFVLSTLPWVLYFGLNGAIGDWLKAYLYDNLFLYGGEGGGLLARGKAMAVSALDWFVQNLRYSLLVPLGLLLCRRGWQGAALWLMTGLGALAAFIGGKSYIYYGLVLGACAAAGLAHAAAWLQMRITHAPRWLAAALCALCVALTPALTQNVDAGYGVTLFQPMEDTMQGRIAAVIRQTPNATLLNYGFMDAGFYTAAGVTPHLKYFHQTNVPMQEMKDEQQRYIREGLSEFVVTRGSEPAFLHENYQLVATEKSPNFWYDSVYLYRLKR